MFRRYIDRSGAPVCHRVIEFLVRSHKDAQQYAEGGQFNEQKAERQQNNQYGLMRIYMRKENIDSYKRGGDGKSKHTDNR